MRILGAALVLLAAVGCSSNSSAPAVQFLKLPPFLVDLEGARTSGVVGTVFAWTATATGNAEPIAEWAWDFGDGTTAPGADAQHAYGEAGFFPVVVTATDARGDSVAASLLVAIYPAPGTPATAPGGLSLPARIGDVDDDGFLTVADAHLVLTHSRGLRLLQTEGQVVAADLDLDGAITDADALLLAAALAADAPLPRRITPDRGAPGTGVNVISPALLDPEAVVSVQVGAAAPTPLFRPLLGYASFLVPFDAAPAVTSRLAGRAIPVRILVDGVEQDVFDFDLLDPEPVTGEPGQALVDLMGEVPRLLAALRPLLSDYLDFVGASGDERALLEALLMLAEEEFANAEPQIAEAFALLDEETRIRLHQVANANGLAGALADLQEFLGERRTQASGDILIETVCGLQRLEEILKKVDGVAGWVCNFVQVCALVPSPAQPVCAGLVPACAAFSVTNDIAGLVIGLTPKPDPALVVVAEPSTVTAGEQAEIRAYLRLRGTEALCLTGAGQLRKHLQKQLALRMFSKVGGVKLAARILQKYPLDQRGALRTEVLDKLRGLLDFLVGKVLDLVGINQILDDLQKKICAALQGAVGPSPFTLPLQNTIFGDPQPADAGTLVEAPVGSNAPAIFTCQPPDGTTRTVTIEADRVGCTDKERLKGSVKIRCSSGVGDVTITIGDNGNALDDIFEVQIDGETVLTSSVPVRNVSTTVALTHGRHTLLLIGRAAPDFIGTYFMTIDGATVVDGPPLSGTNLTAGTVFTYTIEVTP